MQKKWAVSSKLALAVSSACLGMAAKQAVAQPADQQIEQLTVTGSRLVTSGLNTPTPVMAVSGLELQTMEPGTLIDSLKQLPQFYSSLTTQQSAGGSVAAGGSNVNLRGLSAQRTLALLDGRRIGPSNKFGTVDVAVIPEMLIRSVEAVTGGASAAYGADAVAGVVNFRLDRNFSGMKYELQGGSTTYHDDYNYKAGLAYGTQIGERGHIVSSVETYHKDGTNTFGGLEDRRDFIKLNSQVTNPVPGGPTLLARPYVAPTNYTAGGVLLQPGSSLDHVEFLPDGSGRYRRLPFSGVGQLTGGCNCQALPSLDYGVNSDFQADTRADRDALFTHFDYDVNDRNTFFVETLLSNTQAANRWQTVALLGPWVGRVFADNPFLPGGIRQTMQSEGLQSAGFGIFTPNTEGNPFDGSELIAKNRYGQLTGGFTHTLPDDFLAGGWALDGYVQHAENRQETVAPGGIRTDRLFLAMDAVTGPTGDPVCRASLFNPGLLDDCVPIDLFGGTAAVTPAAANYVTDNGKIARGRTTEDDVEVTFRGNLTKGSGGVLGPLTAAFGLSWREERLAVRTVDPCDEFPCRSDGVLLSDIGLNPLGYRGILANPNCLPFPASAGICGLRYVPPGFAGDSNSSTVLFTSQRAVEGGYNVREAFFEFGIPLLKDGKLNLDEAFRSASYTGSGNTQAWKSGVSYQATPKLRVRATRSQDVRAPTLQERFESQRGGVNVPDLWNDPSGATIISTASFSGGNPAVGLETALTDTIGIVYQPLDKFSMTLDSYDINLDGAIGQLPALNIVRDCYNSPGHDSSSLCQYVVRDATGEINRVDSVFINLSNQRVRGADLELNLSGLDVGRGSLGWRLIATRLNENSILTPGNPRDDRAGEVGGPGGNPALPKNKVTTSLNFAHGPISVFLQARYIGGGLNDRNLVESNVPVPGKTTIDDNTVSAVTYTDLTFSYSGGKGGSTPWQAFLTVNNLANTAPPDMYPALGRAGVPGPNSFLYDTIGRRFVAGVRVNF
jgi:outer membrane receptor protein involved in Fe transport